MLLPGPCKLDADIVQKSLLLVLLLAESGLVIFYDMGPHFNPSFKTTSGPRQANLVLIAYASSEGSSEPAHPRSLARTFAARSYKQ